ncbi:UNKNOWN [Stylonychia lemnae]|uniref:EF-hand domain-containing protein n=1 Tax=Stylonychia lemnae TaxID=5949 RepID=A0A078APC3_STYLE|nr:UNKNOWN [Stylonychia lemnae]|eukprot:CDW83979.1 UNKNOWN [Stylonychia lemnae]
MHSNFSNMNCKSNELFLKKRRSLNDVAQSQKEPIWTPNSALTPDQSIVSHIMSQQQCLIQSPKLGKYQKFLNSSMTKGHQQSSITQNFRKLNINKEILHSMEQSFQMIYQKERLRDAQGGSTLIQRKSHNNASNNDQYYFRDDFRKNQIIHEDQMSLKSGTLKLKDVYVQQKLFEKRYQKSISQKPTTVSLYSKRSITPSKIEIVCEENKDKNQPTANNSNSLNKNPKYNQEDGKSVAKHKIFRNRLSVTQDYLEREIDLNFKLFELRQQNQTFRDHDSKELLCLVEGTQALINEQFDDLLDFKPENNIVEDSHLSIDTFMDLFINLSKNYRYLLRVIKALTDQLENKDTQFQALKCFSVFWKSVTLVTEYFMQNRSLSLRKASEMADQTYNERFSDLQSKNDNLQIQNDMLLLKLKSSTKQMTDTIDKLNSDKKQLQEILQDRENELKLIQDPRQMRELKNLLNELDQNMQVVDKEKQIQYNEMQACVGIIHQYKLEWEEKNRSQMNKKIILRRIKKGVNHQVIDKAIDQKREAEHSVIKQKRKIEEFEVEKDSMRDDVMKELMFEIMGNEIDLYMEFKNQKEAMIRKEKILGELANIIRHVQELDEDDEQYKISQLKIDKLQLELDRINKGFIEGYKYIQVKQKTIAVKEVKPLFILDTNQKNNPIVKAISQLMNSTQTSAKQQGFDPKNKLADPMIIKMMEQTMEEKVKSDLENISSDIDHKKAQTFASFLYDSILMQYGLKTIAVKNVIQLCNGLKVQQSQAYANYLGRIIGILPPSLDRDQIDSNNLGQGGECAVCDLMDEFKVIFKDDKEMLDRFLTNLKPDQIQKMDETNSVDYKKKILEFCMVKIIYKVSKIGKDIKHIYDVLDQDKSGSLDQKELIGGLRGQLAIFITDEESEELVKYLDSDGSGDIDFKEFSKKVNFKDLQQKQHYYTISKVQYLDCLIKEWELFKRRENGKIRDFFYRFDENGDGVLAFDEFETLIKALDPNIKKKQVVNLFSETLDGQDQLDDTLNIDSFIQTVTSNKIGGFGKVFFQDYIIWSMNNKNKNITPKKIIK